MPRCLSPKLNELSKGYAGRCVHDVDFVVRISDLVLAPPHAFPRSMNVTRTWKKSKDFASWIEDNGRGYWFSRYRYDKQAGGIVVIRYSFSDLKTAIQFKLAFA